MLSFTIKRGSKIMKKGFTLAEILITLGIVGVVAALTLPGVVMSYQKKVYVAQLQRIYNQFVNGTKAVMAENGLDSLKEADSNLKKASTFLNKIVTVSRTGSASSVMASNYKSLNSDKDIPFKMAEGACVVVDTGASICMENMQASGYAVVYLDLNGQSKPNVIGRDFFNLVIEPSGKIQAVHGSKECKEGGSLYAGNYCLGTVRGENWTMDY